MGLDCSHGAWHGAYSAFHRWRLKIAAVAGIPLPLMVGHFGYEDFNEADVQACFKAGLSAGTLSLVQDVKECCEAGCFPIPWRAFEHDPLVTLLHHSDCDGDIAPEQCLPLAARLSELLPLLDGDGGGHVGSYREKTEQFIAGLRLAGESNEPLVFA